MQEKILGWDIDEIVELMNMVSQNSGKRMLDIFANFAQKNGRKVFSVRNFYYSLLREISSNQEVKNLLSAKGVILRTTSHFELDEEVDLLKAILLDNNKSVRGTCFSLANGEKTKAIRYQNKYRNLLKSKYELVKNIAGEIINSGQKCRLNIDNKILKIPTQKQEQSIITEEEIQSLFWGLVRLVKRSAEQELESRQNYQIKIENSKLGEVELDNRRKAVLISELQEQNNKLLTELEKVKIMNENYEQSYMKIQNWVKDNKMVKLREFMSKFDSFEQKNEKKH